ncbi:MAG: CDP-archaeol synthase [Chloroflexi bacterium]|nr:CDP-archaeol synthase [Chloroflexota bacterium]
MEAQASGRAVSRSARAVSAGALKRRLISAAIGLPIVVGTVIAGVPATTALASAAALVAGYEIADISRTTGFRRASILLLPVVLVAVGLSIAADRAGWTAAWAIVAAVLVICALPKRRGAASGVLLSLAASLYLGALLAHTPPLRSGPDGARWLLLVLLATFAVDTAAYFTGRSVGRRKMAPSISPRKTWEGAAGGLVAGVLAGLALRSVLSLRIEMWEAAALGLAIAIASVLGDLVESWFKRRGGVKDAGGLIPGHGGVMDRLDSLAPNLVIVYYTSVWIGG